MPLDFLRRGYAKGSIQDGNREFITVMACVNALGNVMPPVLLYASESGDLQDTWIQDFDYHKDLAYFGASEKGWTTHVLTLEWLQRFHEATFGISGYSKRVLILDGHSSHVNLDFLQLAIDYNILIVVLPPHSTHRLQPLDVSVFNPLANYYSQNIDNYLVESRGYSRMTKRLFWSLFWPAWQKAVRYETISSGFRKSGIYPFNPNIVIDQLVPEPIDSSTSESSDEEVVLTEPRKIQKFVKELRDEWGPMSSKMETICYSIEHLALENELLRHENSYLNKTIINETKAQKRGKPAGLLGKDEPKYGQIWSPTKLALRKQEIDDKKLQEEREKQQKDDDKLQAKILQDEKKREDRERINNNKIKSERKKALKLAEAEARRRDKELKKAISSTKKPLKKTPNKSSNSQKAINRRDGGLPVESNKIPESTTVARSGRKVNRPLRFLQ